MKERAHCFTILDLSYACFQVIQGQVADLILEAVQIHLDLGAKTQSKKTGKGKANDGLIGNLRPSTIRVTAAKPLVRALSILVDHRFEVVFLRSRFMSSAASSDTTRFTKGSSVSFTIRVNHSS